MELNRRKKAKTVLIKFRPLSTSVCAEYSKFIGQIKSQILTYGEEQTKHQLQMK